MLLQVKRIVDHRTKEFCFLDHLKLFPVNFQMQIIIPTFEDVMHFLGRNKQRIRFRNIYGEFIALKPSIELYEIVIDSFIKEMYIRRLVAQIHVISIHGDDRILDSMQ